MGNPLTNDFMATLDTGNRQIVVLLNSGMTSRTEIAERLGCANHSAMSKRLTQIRKAAENYFYSRQVLCHRDRPPRRARATTGVLDNPGVTQWWVSGSQGEPVDGLWAATWSRLAPGL